MTEYPTRSSRKPYCRFEGPVHVMPMSSNGQHRVLWGPLSRRNNNETSFAPKVAAGVYFLLVVTIDVLPCQCQSIISIYPFSHTNFFDVLSTTASRAEVDASL
jgi:hypothetical protein